MEFEDYEKYRWFYTSSGKLVIGGKNAEQNEELLKQLKSLKKDRIIMHTKNPGSPFAVILTDIKFVKKSDIDEAAVFTASFSRAWKDGKKKTHVDIFHLSNVYKKLEMKAGTWGVKGKIKRVQVSLSLVLAKQKLKLRAVPEKSVKKDQILCRISPGKSDKQSLLPKLKKLFPKFSTEEILQALPAGGIRIRK